MDENSDEIQYKILNKSNMIQCIRGMSIKTEPNSFDHLLKRNRVP
jgi:hypothetical protein